MAKKTAATTTLTAETMTSHVGRLYAVALALFVFFLSWSRVRRAAVGASGAKSDARLAALVKREQRMRRAEPRRSARHAAALGGLSSATAAAEDADRVGNQAQLAAPQAPPVRVVNLPPLTSRGRRDGAAHFRAMGTDIELLVDAADADGALDAAEPSSTGWRRSCPASGRSRSSAGSTRPARDAGPELVALTGSSLEPAG